ncbi:thiol reductant ABC exporter subunit CydC [Curtobacterium sp. MCJR17_055]|uniref:thiol reductant ABC exporter subunit CydC n=1 Tax=unclassified Curtobacterium TaxID=257496 RepID=UPI000D822EC6|nr:MULTISPECIES: thiol reductant ABC exporter subunit CydC [unclassified Curtobacterium]PYY34156.1 thiol reductant ABC exporter subunit CydC [Curtobacterium sp. MCBD17_029]PYY54007.1 thiol reductant ABC exporter subunit CydC [Curtobacterium sp. MCJR17_055]PYY59106.1 thiol reductant ABC exporter subunit CydC [Curtobacterium sp. MCPF17_015]
MSAPDGTTGTAREARPPSVLRLAMPRGRGWAKAVAAGVLSALCAVALLAASGYLITRAAEHPPILYLTLVMVGVRAFALGRAALRYVDRLSGHDASFRQLAVVRTEMYRRLASVAPAGLGSSGRGDLLTRLVTDTDRLQDLPIRVVGPLVSAGVTALLSVVAVAFVSPPAALVLLLALGVAALVGTVVTSVVATRSDRETAADRGHVADLVLDTVRTLDVFTAYGTLEERLAHIARLDDRVTRAVRRRGAVESLVGALVGLVCGAAVLGVLAVGAPAVVSGALDGPLWALAVFVPLALSEVVGVVPLAVLTLRRVRAAAERVEQVVPAELPTGLVPEPDAAASAEELAAPATVAVRVRDLSVRWPGAAAPAVDEVSFDLEPGEVVVLRGPSGSGKSSLVDALVRFVEHTGSYTLDGVEARTLHPDAVRARVGFIEQDPFVFDQSVRQNLLFARDSATDEDLLAVLDRVGLGEWVARRGGLDAGVGERGALVSGGQAHRLALARALLHAFPVLVLDEPTADIDPDLGDAVLRDLVSTARAAGRTLLVVSHVPVPADLVDRTLRMADGRLLAA